jgi:hypothetical protein
MLVAFFNAVKVESVPLNSSGCFTHLGAEAPTGAAADQRPPESTSVGAFTAFSKFCSALAASVLTYEAAPPFMSWTNSV